MNTTPETQSAWNERDWFTPGEWATSDGPSEAAIRGRIRRGTWPFPTCRVDGRWYIAKASYVAIQRTRRKARERDQAIVT